jgi:hypothetical protein
MKMFVMPVKPEANIAAIRQSELPFLCAMSWTVGTFPVQARACRERAASLARAANTA